MRDTLYKKIDKRLDCSDMEGAIKSFPYQIKESFLIMDKWSTERNYTNIKNIMVLGMGGSAIGGDIARVIIRNHCTVPVIVNRSYTIPGWVNSETLIFVCSYSGNTEETLNAFSQCLERHCPVLIFSTGGKLIQYAESNGMDQILLPTDYQPRAALGFSFTLMLLALNRLGFIEKIIIDDIKDSISSLKLLSKDLSKSNNLALEIAGKIHKTCPIIYGSEDMTWVVAVRFRCQLAENSKMLSFHHEFPEQNHNEIEGWTVNKDIMRRFSIIWIKDIDDHAGTKKRMDISSSLLESISGSHITIKQSGPNRIQRLLKLIHLTDWISYYAGLLNNIDPTPVTIIQTLKHKISQ